MPLVGKLSELLRRTASGASGIAASAGNAAQKAGKSVFARIRQDEPPAPAPEPLPPQPIAPAPEPGRIHTAAAPQMLTRQGWWEVTCRVYDETFRDRLMLIAAGVAFYVMLSLFPALTVLIWFYGFFADPAQIVSRLQEIAFLLPSGALDIIQQQARAIASTGPSSMNTLIVTSILVAIWSANAGMKSMFDAMNIIYGEDEKRSILVYNLHSLLFTAFASAIFLATLAVLVFVPILLSYVNLQGTFARIFVYLRWPLLYAITVVFLILLNRYGPSRPRERARWSLWGSALGAALWIAVSVGFSWYVEHLSNLAATYGSIAAIVGLMLWLWLSALVILIGIELNHELELRTMRWEEQERHRVELEEWERRRALVPSPQEKRPRGLTRWWKR